MYRELFTKWLKTICPNNISPDWDSFKISLFCSNPHIRQEEWIRRMISSNCASVLEDSLDRVNIRSFFNFFPLEIFRDKWPTMRLYCQKRQKKRRGLFDLAWSILETATPLVPPLPDWFLLSDKEKSIIRRVSANICLEENRLDYKEKYLIDEFF